MPTIQFRYGAFRFIYQVASELSLYKHDADINIDVISLLDSPDALQKSIWKSSMLKEVPLE